MSIYKDLPIKDYRRSLSSFQLQGAIAIISPQKVSRADLLTLPSDRLSDSSDRTIDNIIDTYLPRYPYLYPSFITQTQQFPRLTKH